MAGDRDHNGSDSGLSAAPPPGGCGRGDGQPGDVGAESDVPPRTEWTALFSFLRNPAIDATNWRAEQAIRPAVVTRKVCGGNRSWRGAHTQQILTSLIRTARQRRLDPHAAIADTSRAPRSQPSHLTCKAQHHSIHTR